VLSNVRNHSCKLCVVVVVEKMWKNIVQSSQELTISMSSESSFVAFAQTFKAKDFNNLAINALSAITPDIKSNHKGTCYNFVSTICLWYKTVDYLRCIAPKMPQQQIQLGYLTHTDQHSSCWIMSSAVTTACTYAWHALTSEQLSQSSVLLRIIAFRLQTFQDEFTPILSNSSIR
jgi:hypothetical protein